MQYSEKLAALERKHDELTAQLSDRQVFADPAAFQKTAKAHAELREVVEKYREWKDLEQSLQQTKTLIGESSSDPEMKALAHEEVEELQKRIARVEEELKILLLPRDPNDEKNVILEIRAGTGGDEATLFAQEMFRMYSRYAERRGWKTEILNHHTTGVGRLKEVIVQISGDRVYSQLKFESGVHRVQRV